MIFRLSADKRSSGCRVTLITENFSAAQNQNDEKGRTSLNRFYLEHRNFSPFQKIFSTFASKVVLTVQRLLCYELHSLNSSESENRSKEQYKLQ